MLECEKSGIRAYIPSASSELTIQASLPVTVSMQNKPHINIFMTVKLAGFLHTGVVKLKQNSLDKPEESHTFARPNNCYEPKVSA
jgi:hypothetical protein